MTDDGHWGTFLVQVSGDDPDWRQFYDSLDPSMPLRKAVRAFIEQVSRRIAPTPTEIEAADRILARLAERGIRSADELVAQVDAEVQADVLPRRGTARATRAAEGSRA